MKIGRYRVTGEVSRVPEGDLYLARDEVLNRDVLVKLLPEAASDDPELRARFAREARLLAELNHPNIVTVVDVAEAADRSFIVMARQRCTSLQNAIKEGVTIRDALRVVAEVLDGLAYVHSHGIVHRAVTPSNILMPEGAEAQIMCFFYARYMGSPLMAGTGRIIGTASPEVVRGHTYDGRHDLFAVGCILYGLLAGVPPFHSEDQTAMLHRVAQEPVDMTLIPSGPEWGQLRAIIERSLQKRREDRFPDAVLMSGALVCAVKELGGEADRMVSCECPQDLPTGSLLFGATPLDA
jgi:serine/threonine-protein kinase